MSTVSLVRCENYDRETVDLAVRRAVDHLGGISKYVKPGNRVLLKPNLLSARPPEKRITTDPEVVRAVARLVLEAGARPVIGDSPGLDSFRRVAARTGMAGVADDLGIELAELNQPTRVPPTEGAIFKRLELASLALESDVVINLPKLKTHSQMLLTLGVKNLFGTVVAQRKAEWHMMAGVDRDIFASLHLDIYCAVRPALTLLDGIWAMEGHGPSNGKPRHLGMIAASEDAVALDVAVCHILGVPLRSFPLYRAARSRGIGETDPNKTLYLGEPPHAFSVPDFQVPRLDSLGILPHVFGWFTKRFLVSRPLHEEARCAGCGRCVDICPAGAMSLRDKRISFDYHRCIRCYCCQEICEENALHFRKGLLVRILNRLHR